MLRVFFYAAGFRVLKILKALEDYNIEQINKNNVIILYRMFRLNWLVLMNFYTNYINTSSFIAAETL